jgi:hypothetical protein
MIKAPLFINGYEKPSLTSIDASGILQQKLENHNFIDLNRVHPETLQFGKERHFRKDII